MALKEKELLLLRKISKLNKNMKGKSTSNLKL